MKLTYVRGVDSESGEVGQEDGSSSLVSILTSLSSRPAAALKYIQAIVRHQILFIYTCIFKGPPQIVNIFKNVQTIC